MKLRFLYEVGKIFWKGNYPVKRLLPTKEDTHRGRMQTDNHTRIYNSKILKRSETLSSNILNLFKIFNL
jgi:hypothetical protein